MGLPHTLAAVALLSVQIVTFWCPLWLRLPCFASDAGQRCAALRRNRRVLRVDFKLLSYTSLPSVTVVTKQLGQEHLSEELASAADSPGTCLPAWPGPLLISTKKNPALWSFILALIAWILIAEFGNILQL